MLLFWWFIIFSVWVLVACLCWNSPHWKIEVWWSYELMMTLSPGVNYVRVWLCSYSWKIYALWIFMMFFSLIVLCCLFKLFLILFFFYFGALVFEFSNSVFCIWIHILSKKMGFRFNYSKKFWRNCDKSSRILNQVVWYFMTEDTQIQLLQC